MANRIHDAFDNIKAQPQLIESTKQYISQEQRHEIRPVRNMAFRKVMAAVCLAFVLVAGIGGYTWFQTPVSYVSIDVNPSVELALNRLDRVVSIDAYNMQGEEILKNLSLIGKKYTDAIDLIVGSKEMGAYLTDEEEIVFAVAAPVGREGALQSGVERCASHSGHKSQSIRVDLGMVSQAHGHGLSLGKYYTYLQLARYDDTVTVDDCKNMSMAQMHGMIYEHEHGGGKGHEQEEEHTEEEGNISQEAYTQEEGQDSSTDHGRKQHQNRHHRGEGHE